MNNCKLTEVREERRLSMHALADATGVNQAAISRYENGTAGIGFRSADKIAYFFNLPVEEIFPEYTRASPYPVRKGG